MVVPFKCACGVTVEVQLSFDVDTEGKRFKETHSDLDCADCYAETGRGKRGR